MDTSGRDPWRTDRLRRRSVLGLAAGAPLVALGGLAGLSTARGSSRPAAAPAAVTDGFVRRSGQQLLLNGAPYHFTGLNIYNANSVNNYWYTLGTGGGLDAALSAIGSGTNVFRAWFGQWLANPNGSGIDYSVFDHTLRVARAHGYKVIVVFADQDGSWDDGISKTLDSNWYQSGYRSTVSTVASSWGARNALTYRAFVGQVVARYRNDPTVLMWQLLNEAELKLSDGSCSTATDDAGSVVLRAFADDMGGYVRSLDPNHLISLGSIGTGQCGTSGARYQYVYASPNIDLTEMHDYVANQDIIGDQWNGMALRLQQSKALNKPLFVGELGIDPGTVGGVAGRAARIGSKLTAQFAAGVVGAVVWEWRNAGQSGGDAFVVGPGDPALPVLALSRYFPIPPPTAGGWTLNGSAALSATALTLTNATTPNSAGSAFWPTPVSTVALQVSFDATLSGGTGADGLTLALADPTAGASATSLGVVGGGLGWSGIPGVAVALDTYQNGHNPSANFVGVAAGHLVGHGDWLSWLATSTAVPALRTGTHHVVVGLAGQALTVSVDGSPVIRTTVALPSAVLVGFTAGDGGLTDSHVVTNVRISTAS